MWLASSRSCPLVIFKENPSLVVEVKEILVETESETGILEINFPFLSP